MLYEAELRLLRQTFWKCRLQTLLVDPSAPLNPKIDMGLLKYLGNEEAYQRTPREILPEINPRVIYKLADTLDRHYIYLLLPDMPQATLLLIGPYLSKQASRRQIMESAEAVGVSPKFMKELENYYGNLPTWTEDSHLFALLDSFAERIWGGSGQFQVIDVNQEADDTTPTIILKKDGDDADKSAWNMEIMEARYAYENELMQAVSQGQAHKAELLFAAFSTINFEKRLADPVRNLKNYSIIMNTLLRKAAENGGVHPVYLDSVSSAFARKIEQMTNTEAVQELMNEMYRSYCRLVRKHSMSQYSPPVQKAIITIDSDLTANLSLSTLAAMQGISSSYLSALFRTETGQTLTEHVNKKRVKHAQQLLATTKLQVQTIAQHCGILDVHYFSKVFKKYTGKTPKEYREESQGR